MSTKGFIKLDRDIDEHWVFQRDPEFRIWIYLILKSQFSNQKKPVMIGNTERTLQRGEILTTIERIAGDLNLNPRVVRRCLDLFKKNDMIVKTTGRGKGIPYVAKIVNYEKWQGEYTYQKAIKGQSSVNQKAFKSQYYNNYNNGNNGNNEKANYIYQCEVHQEEFEESYMSDLLTTCTKCDLSKTRYTREFFDKINKPQST